MQEQEWREVFESDEMKEIIFDAVRKLFREESPRTPGTTNQPEHIDREHHLCVHMPET